ncbi:hypothetical protein BvCmsOUNP037_04638 [Escherichia coli]|nr:hypothetical protein BvCmsOUNP037_04638 [Escherichia coli]
MFSNISETCRSFSPEILSPRLCAARSATDIAASVTPSIPGFPQKSAERNAPAMRLPQPVRLKPAPVLFSLFVNISPFREIKIIILSAPACESAFAVSGMMISTTPVKRFSLSITGGALPETASSTAYRPGGVDETQEAKSAGVFSPLKITLSPCR